MNFFKKCLFVYFYYTYIFNAKGSQAEDYGSGLAVMIETVRILMLDSSYK